MNTRQPVFLVTALLALAACDQSAAPPPAPPPTAAPAPSAKDAPVPAKAKAAPKAKAWDKYKAADYGIELIVPDLKQCKMEEKGDIGHMHCTHGDIGVHVLAHEGVLSLDQLKREAAKIFDDVPYDQWTFEPAKLEGNGYKQAEAWSASASGWSVVGVAGRSSAGNLNHVAFIYGKDSAFKSHQAEIDKFVNAVRVAR